MVESVRSLVLGGSSSGAADPLLVAAVSRGGGLGVLDLGDARAEAAEALRRTRSSGMTSFAVRIPAGTELRPEDVLVGSDDIEAVVLGRDSSWSVASAGPRVLVEVWNLTEAIEAVREGADGLVAIGSEAAGGLTSFVLFQQLMAAGLGLPIWVSGAIGPRTAVAVVAGGAAGVVLDSQLELFPDTDSPRELRESLLRDDTSSATLFAARFDSAEQAVRELIHDLVAREVIPVPVEQGAPLCRTLGTRLAVAQGPMTRVSDQPGFAASVAEHGAMPFVAVALSTGEQTADLLRRTADALGERPWGAGILGFVPEALRAEQLEAIRRAKPRSVLIAGGRPAQAKALEAEGIATYLHVPSPVLLQQYLDAGARRFVFEGSECGGHIGPRSSFSLWEAQLDVLESFADVSGVEVFFAGGIHDARSAAMVSAMAAPLARRGAGIGVLMGTAYLFTEEAVRHGAITELFQRKAVDAVHTAVLETAPGHLTRCLESPFVGEFEARERQLRESGVPAQERWKHLEDLNIGRLRIASKGLRREHAELVAVDTEAQLAEGMYMAGQVAVLRDEPTDIAALHRAVTEDAGLLLGTSDRPQETRGDVVPLDIAIVGMSCLFPGAEDLPAFWSNVLRGVDSVGEVPSSRWDPAVYYDADGGPGKTPSKWGGFLSPVPFDPMAFGIPPTSMGSIDPAQLLSLQVAQRALEDAGYSGGGFDRARTGVVFGAEAGGDLMNAEVLRALLPSYVDEVPPELAEQLPTLTEDSFPGTLANVISGRIANRLDLGGPNYTVDAACGSSLAALDLACKELRQRTSDLVLCGAVDLHNGINDYLMFASAGALSPTGKCRPFDSAADGIALGEGVACLVLKRLSDAERDGDRVYAVVKGVGAASDGKALGLTAPRPEGQRRALERAYAGAGVSPSEVGLVEAHGTGTVVGDGTELRTLTDFFQAEGASPGGCALGSVKGQIGHTKCAAGLAGLIKAAMSLWTGVLPPTAHLRKPNSAWAPATSPFSFTTDARPWLTDRSGRVAGVSAFGFGGTNFHAVLAAGASTSTGRHGLSEWDSELFLFRGADLDAAKERMRSLVPLVDTMALRDLAVTASNWADSTREPVRFAIVAGNPAELTVAIGDALTDKQNGSWLAESPVRGKVAFLFPGQGSQRVGMFGALFAAFPQLRHVLDLDPETAATTFPPRAFGEDVVADQEAALRETTAAQPALGLVSSALLELLGRLAVRPDLLGGHSYGELVALSAAGSFDVETLLRLSARRAAAVIGAIDGDPGAMAAVKAGPEAVAGIVGDDVVIANHNAPDQVVLAGPTGAIDRAVQALRAESVGAKKLPVACAFHSPLVAGAAGEFGAALAEETVGAPGLPVWSNRTASPYCADVRAELTAQLGSPVRFAEQIESMYAAGARIFLEVGPGRVLSGLVDAILGDREHTAIVCGSGSPGLREFLTAVGRLAVSGVDVHTEWLFRGRADGSPRPQPEWTVDGRLARRKGGERLPNGLAPARKTGSLTMRESAPDQNRVVADYLRTTRELVAAQRDVLLGYLGQAIAVAVPPALVEVVTPEPVAVVEPPVQEVDVLRSVIGVISDRTGYPGEMIDGDLDLEADLSIDSIKRTEIAGTLVARLGLTERVDDAGQEQLSRKRTAHAMAEWIEGRLGVSSAGVAPQRFLMHEVSAPLGKETFDLRGRAVHVLSESTQEGLHATLEAELTRRGAEVAGAGAEVVVCLTALCAADEPVAPRVFGLLRDAVAQGARTLLVAAPLSGDHAAGLRGLVRAIARERDDVTATLVELDPEADVAPQLVEELLGGGGTPVVRRAGGARTVLELRADLLDSRMPDASALGLDRDSAVLLIGGARGITARFAKKLAAVAGCRIELAGRTQWTGEPEDAGTRGLDQAALRKALSARGGPIAETERLVRTTLARREVGSTLEEVRAAGGQVTYHGVDVRDGAAVSQLVKDLYARHGRIDGIVYAAGVIDDRVMAEKDAESFGTVFGTKVDGALALLDAVTQLSLRPRFVTFFGSIAAVLGNRGQTDYSAANDALETLGASWAERTGNRALTVHWGPWAPSDSHGGMVSDELAREYGRREVRLIDPEEGTSALLRELAFGPPRANAVVYTAALW